MILSRSIRPQSSGLSELDWEGAVLQRCVQFENCNHTDKEMFVKIPSVFKNTHDILCPFYLSLLNASHHGDTIRAEQLKKVELGFFFLTDIVLTI